VLAQKGKHLREHRGLAADGRVEHVVAEGVRMRSAPCSKAHGGALSTVELSVVTWLPRGAMGSERNVS